MAGYHFPVADMTDVGFVGIGTSDEGYDYLELSGDVRITTDNIVALASFFSGLGALTTNAAVQRFGQENVLQELHDIVAGFPFAEPDDDAQQVLDLEDDELLEQAVARLRHPSCPDIQGRDI